MPEKQLNHFIPRLMLMYWEKPVAENRYGVALYEIKKARYITGETRGKKAYSFAIIKNLYVRSSAKKGELNWKIGLVD